MGYAKVQNEARQCEYIVEAWDKTKIQEVWAELTAIPRYSHYTYSAYSLACIILENDWKNKYSLYGEPTEMVVKGPYNPFNTKYEQDGSLYYCRKVRFGVDLRKGKKTLIYSALAIKNGDIVERFGKHFFAPLYEIQWKLVDKAPMGSEIGRSSSCDWNTPLRIVRCYDIDGAMDPRGLIEITDFIDEE